jgi:hypothetical protein
VIVTEVHYLGFAGGAPRSSLLGFGQDTMLVQVELVLVVGNVMD